MMLFEVRNLTKIYGEKIVLDIKELDFEKGLIYSLVGPNGSGKTTLLEILSLIIPPTTGRIKYMAKWVDLYGNNLTVLRRKIVMVRQNPILFTTTVYKNLEFGLKVRGILKKERERIIADSLNLVGMRSFKDAQAHKLSGGETQRIAIAQGLACSPDVMVFDEPTSSVDMENRIAIERVIQEIKTQKKISVIMTTHNLTQTSKLSDKVITLFEGRPAPARLENIFRGEISQNKDGEKLCLLHNDIRLYLKTEKTGKMKISIDPLKIKILNHQNHDPAKNIFKGRIVQLTDEADFIRSICDIGIPLNILLPKEELKDTRFFIGGEVEIYCPEEDIRVF